MIREIRVRLLMIREIRVRFLRVASREIIKKFISKLLNIILLDLVRFVGFLPERALHFFGGHA